MNTSKSMLSAVLILTLGIAGSAMSSTASATAGQLPHETPARTGMAAPSDLPWMNTSLSPARRTKLLLRAMTLDQKLSQLFNQPEYNADLDNGVDGDGIGCDTFPVARHAAGIAELAIPDIRFSNGGTGIQGGDCLPDQEQTALPSGVAGAATFNRHLAYQWGTVLGSELRGWAHQVLWGPAVNMIRTPYGGRNHEYMSEDPYLTGVIGTQQVRGVQANGMTHATIKHMVGNESEYQQERWTAASRIPSRAMQEIYLLPFEMVVKNGHPASVMCSYPNVNFHWSCENKPLLRTTLRKRWGFDGYVVSDRAALHSTVPSIKAGTQWELDFPPTEFFQPDQVRAAIEAGDITEATVDSMLRDRYRKMFAFGHFDDDWSHFRFDQVDYDRNAAVAHRAASESLVLLRNDGLLPLNAEAIDSIALIGPKWFAGEATKSPRNQSRTVLTGVPSDPARTISPEEGLENTLERLGSDATVTYNDGDDTASAVELAQDSDVVILMVGDNPREILDKRDLTFPSVEGTNQELLIPRVLAANPNTVTVLKTSGQMDMPWLRQTRALVEAWYPGQADGDVVADMLFGVTNPSGKLPATWGRTGREASYATQRQYPGVREDNGINGGQGREGCQPPDRSDIECWQLVTHYDENLKLGYRWYEKTGTKPLYPFGYGMSYTTFRYSRLAVTPARHGAHLRIAYTITNTGSRRGKETSQVYLGLPAQAKEPAARLVAFRKVDLAPGQSRRVHTIVTARAANHPLSYWAPADPEDLRAWARGRWVTPDGRYVVHVGRSSASTPLERAVRMDFPDNLQ
jgi:beta-glucosidase